jgi:hypothetical protein
VRVLGKNVEDQCLAVDHVHLERLLEVALLRRCQLVVEDHDVDVVCPGQVGQLGGLALADVERRVERAALDEFGIDRLRPRGIHQQGQLVERSLGFGEAGATDRDPDQQRPLAGYLEVGDSGGEAPSLAAPS